MSERTLPIAAVADGPDAVDARISEREVRVRRTAALLAERLGVCGDCIEAFCDAMALLDKVMGHASVR